MKKIFTFFFYSLTFILSSLHVSAQNVGIGTSTPMEKLHVDGNLRVSGLSSPDTNLVLSDLDGKLINLNSGDAGQVLSSQGPGRAPVWSAAGASADKIHFSTLSGVPSVTCSSSLAGTLSLLTHNFVPANDTVIFNFSSQGRITSTVSLASQPHTYVFRVIVNGVNYRQIYFHLVHNGAGAVTSAFLPANFSLPVPVTSGISNSIQVQVLTLYTVSGTLTLSYDTSAWTQFATSTIYDFRTN